MLGSVGYLGLACYLLFAFVEGFLASRRKGRIRDGVDAGCLVGGIALLTLAIAVLVPVVLFSVSAAENCPPYHSCSSLAVDLGLIPIFLFFALEGLCAPFVCLLGGWLGGLLGEKIAEAR